MAAQYNQYIQRGSSYADNPGAGAANLVPVEQADQIISAMPNGSAALQMFTHVPMGRLQTRVPVVSVLPQAYWVSGEVTPGSYANGLKPTTYMNWEGRYLTAEELAVIVPVPENLLADTQYDLIGNMTPLIADAVARQLDQTVFFGYNKPASFPPGIVEQAMSIGNVVTAGTAAQAQGSLAADIANLFATVENDGFDISGVVARIQMRSRIRNARTTFGEQLDEVTPNNWYGEDVTYAMRGLWPTYAPGSVTGNTTNSSAVVTNVSSTTTLSPGDYVSGTGIPSGAAIQSVDSATQFTLDANATAAGTAVTITPVAPSAVAGDMSQALLGIRSDISYKILSEAVLTDASGNIQFNLAQQDAIALRVVARFGFAVANAATWDQPTESARWPFGVLLG